MNNSRKMTGIIKRHPDGFGFFIADDAMQPDAYIPPHYMTHVMTHDRVTAQIYQEKNKNRFWGKILSIDQRYWKTIVAPIVKSNNIYIAYDTEGAWGQNIIVDVSPSFISDLKDKNLGIIVITHYPNHSQGLCGKLIKILGPIENAIYDIERVARTQNIPFDFPPEVITESLQFDSNFKINEVLNRIDLRNLPFITIDGATAKDFDDAIYVERRSKSYQLYVAIADVSYYVKPNSAIDKEAYQRGTSCYFPNYVIPMLPEILSNDLCSLNPGVNRLAFVCEMNIDSQGHLKKFTFYEAIIKSKARLTYGLAQEILDHSLKNNNFLPFLEEMSHLSLKDLDLIAQLLNNAKNLAQILLKKRLSEGSLDLEIPETQVLVDSLGNPVEIIKTHRLFAHRIIEELMLITNVATARFFEKHQITGIYRIHENPKKEQIDQLAHYARSFGIKINPNHPKLQIELRKALEQLSSTIRGEILSSLILRSMKQAQYSTENIGHFGLSFSHYAHFTSPIRRYPDLIAHRLIKAVLKNKKQNLPSEENLRTFCTWLSATEQRAVKAERLIISIKKARFIKNFVGQSFNGIITSVTKFGFFVTLREYEVDGLVHIENITNNPRSYWEFNEDLMTLTEKKSKFSFRLGDSVKVKILASDIVEGKIDFILDDTSFKKSQESTKYQPIKASKKPKSSTPKLLSKASSTPPATSQPKSNIDKFNPAEKLLQAIKNRGLKPSRSFLSQEGLISSQESSSKKVTSRKKITFSSKRKRR